jgi:acetylornithine deacetylase/succinyl-diaminopimelate desuccinylase-like protein
MTTPEVLDHIEANLDAARERWFEVLRIPSISAQPAHAGDCRRAAEWFLSQLGELGFRGGLHETAGHPVVLAHHDSAGAGAPCVLFYGHYDVQPAEPLELWTAAPFDPELTDGPHGPRVVARGAVDDKGQVMMWLESLRAWHAATGTLPVRVTVLLEGEEEVGSPNLEPFLAANRAALRADVCVISDTGMWDIDTPALTTRLRGMAYTELTVKAADKDLHSGIFGGSALNPINTLTAILGGLQDVTGRIQLPGFYDGVAETPPALAAEWEGLRFDEGAFLAGVGLAQPAGEHGRPALERLWNRPTADINGIWGGYQGPGAKTVIAAEAGAKVSFRLVPGQDPAAVADSFRAFVAARTPPGVQTSVALLSAAPGVEIPGDSRWIRAAQMALAAEYGRPAVLIGSGGSIPVVESMKRLLGLDSLLMGFGLNDDQVHSPNEKFEWRCFHHGLRAHARLLGGLGSGA